MAIYLPDGKGLLNSGKLVTNAEDCCCCKGSNYSFTFKACIDRNLSITIVENKIQIHPYGSGSILLPGEHPDCPSTSCGTQILVNGVIWVPVWDGYYSDWFVLGDEIYFDGTCCILSVVKNLGRGSVSASGNSVIINDDAYGGPDCYDVTISWTCE